MANCGLVDGLKITNQDAQGMCEDCIYGKATKKPFDKVLTHETKVLERVHVDLFGPARTQSRGGATYLMLCTDGRSSFRVPHYLSNKRKETGVRALHEYRIMAEKQTGKLLRTIRIDGGGELNNGLVDDYCRENGITIEKVPHDSSAANGVAERAFRTVIEGTQTLLEDADLPYSFWAEASSTFIYVDNFVPSARFPDTVPIEAWTQKRQDISHLRPFGCDCWATLPRRRTDGKLGRQAVRGKLLGYMGRRGYRVWVPETKKIEESHDVTFEEGRPHRTRMPVEVEGEETGNSDLPGTIVTKPTEPGLNTCTTNPANFTRHDSGNIIPEQLDGDQRAIPAEPQMGIPQPLEPQLPQPLQPPQPAPTRHSGRGHIPSQRYIDSEEYRTRESAANDRGEAWSTDEPAEQQPLTLIAQTPFAFAATHSDLWVPQSFKQAMKQPDLWTEPMEKEFRTLTNKDCWELTSLPPEANLTGGRWTYTIKFDAEGKLLKRKARYVAQGYTQI